MNYNYDKALLLESGYIIKQKKELGLLFIEKIKLSTGFVQ
jgi:hypothetical protein